MSSSSSSHDDHNGDAPPSSSDPPLSQRLWSRYEPLGVCALHHPFVRGLGSGRLCPTAFKVTCLPACRHAWSVHSVVRAVWYEYVHPFAVIIMMIVLAPPMSSWPSLPQGYVAQDAFFLRSFAQAYQLAADRAATDQATVQSLT